MDGSDGYTLHDASTLQPQPGRRQDADHETAMCQLPDPNYVIRDTRCATR
jgi:hypothetical protein